MEASKPKEEDQIAEDHYVTPQRGYPDQLHEAAVTDLRHEYELFEIESQ